MINDEYKKQMLNIISMYDRKAEDFLKKLHDEGIRIVMVDNNGVPLKDKHGNLRYNTVGYYGVQSSQRGSRYALAGTDNTKQRNKGKILEFNNNSAEQAPDLIAETMEPTAEAIEIQQAMKANIDQYKKQHRLSAVEMEQLETFIQDIENINGKSGAKTDTSYQQALQSIYAFKEKQYDRQPSAKSVSKNSVLAAVEYVETKLQDHFLKTNNNNLGLWNRLVTVAKVAKLERELRADFSELLKNRRMTPELQNIQRTKDFILYNIKHKLNMPSAELQAYIHELKEIKAILESKKATPDVKVVASSSNKELLSKLSTLKKLIQVGLQVLLTSNKSSDAEKTTFDELSIQVNEILNFPKDLTNNELQERIKKLAAAKVFLDKWLPEIAQRQTKTASDSTTQMMVITQAAEKPMPETLEITASLGESKQLPVASTSPVETSASFFTGPKPLILEPETALLKRSKTSSGFSVS